jgi:hypothetical protein
VTADEHDALLWRLGNLTLLGPKENGNRGNSDFASAKKLYKKATAFGLTQGIAKGSSDNWTEDAINKREKTLARIAVKAWSVRG